MLHIFALAGQLGTQNTFSDKDQDINSKLVLQPRECESPVRSAVTELGVKKLSLFLSSVTKHHEQVI